MFNPKEIKDTKLICSVSGGKDSTAMVLRLLDMGFTFDQMQMVYMDTGWEHKKTYEYLDYLEDFFKVPILRLKREVKIKEPHGPFIEKIETMLGFESPYVRMLFRKNFFSNRLGKWCTSQLKMRPFKDFLKTLEDEYISCVGIRREESQRRSTYPEKEWADNFDCYIWRPIIDFTLDEVIAIHHKHGLIPNHLYLTGSHRVGCWPCIFSRKKEIAALDADRISIIQELENYMTKINNKEMTFFMNRSDAGSITEIAEWAKTSRGGKQMTLFNFEPPTCEKWGLCEFK